MLSVPGGGWSQASIPKRWMQTQGLGHWRPRAGGPRGGTRCCVCLHWERALGISPCSAAESPGVVGVARSPQLTLHPEGKELLHRARGVLGHTHVAGRIGHLCCGHLWA